MTRNKVLEVKGKIKSQTMEEDLEKKKQKKKPQRNKSLYGNAISPTVKYGSGVAQSAL